MGFKETMLGVIGEFMLFLVSVFLLAAFATALLAMGGDPKGYVSIGTPLVLAAGATYTARGYFENEQWKRLSMSTLIAAVALMMSVAGSTGGAGGSLWQTVLGFSQVLVASTLVLLFVYALRVAYLCCKWCEKRDNSRASW